MCVDADAIPARHSNATFYLTIRLFLFIILLLPNRRVAQLGRALRSGRRGRVFESRRADEKGPSKGSFFDRYSDFTGVDEAAIFRWKLTEK